jgi:dTDP-4-amino-4,6-dideoxygalactose transaminase
MFPDDSSVSLAARYLAWQSSWTDFREEDGVELAVALRRGMLQQAVPPVVSLFEKRFAQFSGAQFGLSFCNGTAAIYAALRAVGVQSGNEVLVADYGFHGMAAAILATGARVVPCDIETQNLCFDPEEIDAARSPATRAVLVHNPWGMPANWVALRRVADRAGVALIADASHAHGALCEHQPISAFADITCYSLGLRKLISGGELGCAVTSSPELRDRMLIEAHVNRVPQVVTSVPWTGNAVGLKARPHPLAAVLALLQLDRFPEKLARLCRTCAALEDRFEKLGFAPQRSCWGAQRVHWRLVLRVDESRWPGVSLAAMERAFRESGFPVEPNHYWPVLQEQKIFEWPRHAGMLRARACPRAKHAVPRLITLPAPVQLRDDLVQLSFSDLEKRLHGLGNQ